ncbi:MAG: DivIVA domain-containing protein [Clostridia bacterium]|nr:DivIVA domain-containing protein [Clostridia bacterium]
MITPLDIENKKFNKQMMNGYNVEEVDNFLDEILEDYEKNYKQLSTMNSKVEELNNNLSHYKNIETTLQNTLVMAQSTSEEVKNVAKQQAEQIVEDAKKKAEEIVREAKSSARKSLEDLERQTSEKEKQFDELKKQFDIYRAKMESLLSSQAELLKEINRNEY